MARIRTLTTTGVLVFSFLALLAAHFSLQQFIPSAAIGGGISALLVAMIFSYVLFVRRDIFGFILLVYVCSHFSFGDSNGGLFNVTTSAVLASYLVTNRVREGFSRSDKVMVALLGIFVIWNVLGWILKNPVPTFPLFMGIVAFFGFIFMFRLASNVVITTARFNLFLSLTFFMLLYQLVVALIQRYHLVSWNTPFVGGYMDIGNRLAEVVHKHAPTAGTLRHYELFGEYGALLICLLVPLLSSSFTQRELRFGVNRILVMVFICLSYSMLTYNRASAILAAVTIALYYLILPTGIFSAVDRFGRQIRLIAVIAVLVPVVGAYLGLGELEKKMSSLSAEKFSVAGVVSGKDINRGGLIEMGIARINSDSWWIGYGYGVPRSNRWAWFGVDDDPHDEIFSDLHSLYLSLPMLYGWIGSLAFLSMIVVTAFRLLRVSLRYRRRKNFLMVLAVGFTMFWGIFLIDQYKISILRNPGYQMLFWIWLGLANSVFKTIINEKQENSVPVPSPIMAAKVAAVRATGGMERRP